MKYIVDFKGQKVSRVNYFIPICMEHALVSYGKTVGKDFIKAFCGEWNFEVEKSDVGAINKVADYIKKKNGFVNEYQTYNGVFIKFRKVDNVIKLLEIIEINAKNNVPTLIHMDTYYSYWGRLYNQEHSEHIAVAVGIDREEKKIWIVDPDYSYKSFEVGYSLLSKASNFYLEVIIDDINKYFYSDLINMICERKEYYNKQFENIEKFGIFFGEHFDPIIEFGEIPNIDSVLNSKIINRIRNIIKSRNLFIIFLEQIMCKYNSIENVIEYMYISIGKWNTIMNLLFKESRTGWTQELNERIKSIILSIAYIEKKAYQLLNESRYLHMEENSEDKIMEPQIHSINIDIKAYCNNKGFTHNDNFSQKCDLTNAGEYVLLVDNFDTIKINEICFNTYFRENVDNIICLGQRISLCGVGNVYSVDFLVCAEWGTCEDSVDFEFENGQKISKRIIANDISEHEQINVIKIGCSKTKEGKIVNKSVGITYNRLFIDSSLGINSIILPVNPNMHIISMLVLKK